MRPPFLREAVDRAVREMSDETIRVALTRGLRARSAAAGKVHTWSPDPLTPTRMAHPRAELRYGLVIKPRRGALLTIGTPEGHRQMIIGGFEGSDTVDAAILTGTSDSAGFIYRHLISDIWKFWEPVEED